MKSSKEDEEIDSSIPEPLVPAADEAERLVKETLSKIDKRMHGPVGRSVDAVSEISTRAQLKNLLSEATDRQKQIIWSSLKATGAGALSLIPLLGQVEGVGIAARAMSEAAAMEGATAAQAQALAKGGRVMESGKVALPLASVLGKEGASRLGKVLKAIDPFENIPPLVTLASVGVEEMGLPGATAIPAALQLLVNEYKTVRNITDTASKASQIIMKGPEVQRVKDFGASVITNVQERINRAAAPLMRQAATAFT